MRLPKKYEKFDTKWFAELVDEIEEIKYTIEDVKDDYKKAIKRIEEVESLNSELEIKINSLENECCNLGYSINELEKKLSNNWFVGQLMSYIIN